MVWLVRNSDILNLRKKKRIYKTPFTFFAKPTELESTATPGFEVTSFFIFLQSALRDSRAVLRLHDTSGMERIYLIPELFPRKPFTDIWWVLLEGEVWLSIQTVVAMEQTL